MVLLDELFLYSKVLIVNAHDSQLVLYISRPVDSLPFFLGVDALKSIDDERGKSLYK